MKSSFEPVKFFEVLQFCGHILTFIVSAEANLISADKLCPSLQTRGRLAPYCEPIPSQSDMNIYFYAPIVLVLITEKRTPKNAQKKTFSRQIFKTKTLGA